MKNLTLKSYDDIFRTEANRELVTEITLMELQPFENHPFRVRDDAAMQEMAESIAENGVMNPGIARPRKDGGYELVTGHRRKRACELAGLETMPVIVRKLDDDEAVLLMVSRASPLALTVERIAFIMTRLKVCLISWQSAKRSDFGNLGKQGYTSSVRKTSAFFCRSNGVEFHVDEFCGR